MSAAFGMNVFKGFSSLSDGSLCVCGTGVSIVSGASGAIDAIHYCTINVPLCQAQNAHFSRINCDKELIYLAVLAYSSVFQKRSSDIRRTSLHLKTESCLILFVINNIHFIIYIFNQSYPFISQLLI